MRNTKFCLAVALAGAAVSMAASIPGDAKLGQAVFRTQSCIKCHSMRGEGAKAAPDLAARTAKNYTPSLMASLIWNHAPVMWKAMDYERINKPSMSEGDAADLFAFFFANRYFEKPGDAARGKQVLQTRNCDGCHGGSGPGKPVAEWTVANDSIELTRQLWNHAGKMSATLQSKGMKWPVLTAQDLEDLQVYLQSMPGARNAEAAFQPGPADTGEMIFQKKGCVDCHKGAATLNAKFRSNTMAQLAAAMWNHAPAMKQTVEMRPEEMRRVVGYLWSIQYFEAAGNAAKGKGVFERKRCATCHVGGGAPSLAGMAGKASSMSMVSSLWRHGPDMLKAMNQKKIPWPRFAGSEMADLIAHLNTMK
jgi:cytochrome c2